MNRIEQNMIEDMSEKISTLNDCLTMSNADYETLKCEVLEFFENVKNGLDLDYCIEQFKNGLYNYCDIEVDEEIGLDEPYSSAIKKEAMK